MSGDLPFLVVHGAAIAWIVPVALAALATAVFAVLRWHATHRELRAAIGDRPTRLTGLAPGDATLRGRLSGTASTRVARDDRADVHHTRSDELIVEVAGERVRLIGDVRVIRGTRATAHWRKAPSGARPRGGCRIFTVADGDDVIVEGTLARAGDGDAGYREAGAVWILRARDQAIDLVAVAPSNVAAARGPVHVALGLGLTLLASYGAAAWAGASLVNVRDHAVEPLGPRLQLAAALPGARDRALSKIYWGLRDQPASERELAIELAIIGLREGCAAQADWLVAHDRFEDVLALTHGCDPASDVSALAYLGRYAEAAALAARTPGPRISPRERVAVAIGAGRWQAAADAADAWVSELARDPDTHIHAYLAREIEHARCMVEWLRVQAGDPGAGEQLARLARVSFDESCRLAEIEIDPAGPRCGELARLAESAQPAARDFAKALRWRDGAPGDPRELPYVAGDLDGLREAKTWLVPLGDALGDLSSDRLDEYRTRHALRAMLLGDAVAARDAAQLSPEVAMAIELHTASQTVGGADWLRPPDEPLGTMVFDVMLRRGDLGRRYPIRSCDRAVHEALSGAVAGDGARLAQAIASSCRGDSLKLDIVLAVAPRIAAHRAELAEALRLQPVYDLFHRDFPFDFLTEAAFRRDALHLLGADADAARWQARIAAHRAVLTDPIRVTALLLWNL